MNSQQENIELSEDLKYFQSFINVRRSSLKARFSVALAEYQAGPPLRQGYSLEVEKSDNMAAIRASTIMLLPPSGSMPPSIRDKAMNDAKDYQRVIEASLKGSSSPDFDYILQELIGKGTYGRVYLANHKRTGQQVAIKIINIEALDLAAQAKAFGIEDAQKEIGILARLRDFPTVNVNVFVEAFSAHEHLCIVSEYCSGGSLTTLRRATRGNRLDERYIRPIARELAFALRSVHAAGIVHRDIKCSNVMVNEDGKIQLIDFGVAGIVMTSMEEDKRKTVIGTPHWMAPELQWEKAEIPHGFEVDIWAYGITLYECAMGQPPHANITNPRQLRQLIRKNPIRLAGDSFTPELCDLIQFLLEPDVEKRPTMEQICQHPYVLGTEVQYPTENLQELVQQYCRWESQGGIRHSLWMAGGAEKVENMQSLESQDYDDGWDFSAPNTFRNRMSQIDPSFASYDAFSPMDSGQTYLSSSPPMDDDYFGSRYTTTIEVTDEKSRNSNLRYRSASPEYLQESGKAFRGAKTLGKIFDPRGPGYQYNFGKMSDLPLRQGQGGEASLHRQELSVSSNHGKVPAINLEDVSNKKRATMAWTWNEGLNAGAPVESSNRDSDFFADLPTSRQANPRQSDFFGDLAPNSRQGLDQAGAMPVGADLSDHRASTLDLDALLGPSTSYVLPVRSAPNGFTDLPSTNTTGHSDFPFSASNNRSQHTSYGGTTVASLGEDLMEEPLDAFETEMAAAATESANFTMRPSTYAEPVVRSGHTTTTSQLPTDLVSSPAGSSFDDVARDLPPITSQFPPSFHQPQSPGMTSGLNEWQPASRSPPWMGNEIISGVSNISVAPLPNRENNPQLGGTGPPLPYETQCKVGMKPIFGYPEAFDDRASPEIMEGGLKFHIKQTIDMFDYLTVQLETAYDEEMAQLERMHNQHRQHHSSPTGKEAAAEESDDYEDDDADEDEDEYEDEDAGYEGGQEEYLYHVEDGDEYARAEGDMSSHSA